MSPTPKLSQESINSVIKDVRDTSEVQKKVYFEKIIDFLKWTTTFSMGAILWIGANYGNISNKQFGTISILFLCGAIIIAFILILLVLDRLNDELLLNIEHLESLKNTESDISKTGNDLHSQYSITTRLVNVGRELRNNLCWIRTSILIHGAFIVIGLIFFIASLNPVF